MNLEIRKTDLGAGDSSCRGTSRLHENGNIKAICQWLTPRLGDLSIGHRRRSILGGACVVWPVLGLSVCVGQRNCDILSVSNSRLDKNYNYLIWAFRVHSILL